MPELAEVEFYRKQWDVGLTQKIVRVGVHDAKRIFRGGRAADLKKNLPGATLLASQTHGKRLLFRFSGEQWLGLHLGMSGKLRSAAADLRPGKHDHLVLFQARRTLIFSDPRLFGRVRYHQGKKKPEWWDNLSPSILSSKFTLARMRQRFHERQVPVKAILLDQSAFPGVGNWMADEILWRAKIFPGVRAGDLSPSQLSRLFRSARWVCAEALKIIGERFADPPASWLFGQRWKRAGNCPRDKMPLRKATIAGRTTAWCPRCQPSPQPSEHRRRDAKKN